jgi:hypothetical protein
MDLFKLAVRVKRLLYKCEALDSNLNSILSDLIYLYLYLRPDKTSEEL